MSNSIGVGPGGYGTTVRTGPQSRALLLGWGPDLRVPRPSWLGSDHEPGIYERILKSPPPVSN